MTNLCIRWERIANEILMYFRAQRKLQGEVSLSEAIETDKAGNALYLQDVVGADDTAVLIIRLKKPDVSRMNQKLKK